jgi:hypothetical protein
MLGRLEVAYYLCPSCDLLFTERPHWLDEAYSHALSQLDTGAVERNQACARLTLVVSLALGLPAGATALDYGGGHGVFVRMMRDLGMDFRWFDPRGENLFARGFEGDATRHHSLVTAFEVLEHFAEVGVEVARLFAGRPDAVFVGTELHTGYRPGWWYFMLESGQHVCFYSARTMAFIAAQHGYEAIVGPQHSLFVRRDPSLGRARRLLLRRLLARPAVTQPLVSMVPTPLLRWVTPYRSRLLADHEALRRRVRP